MTFLWPSYDLHGLVIIYDLLQPSIIQGLLRTISDTSSQQNALVQRPANDPSTTRTLDDTRHATIHPTIYYLLVIYLLLPTHHPPLILNILSIHHLLIIYSDSTIQKQFNDTRTSNSPSYYINPILRPTLPTLVNMNLHQSPFHPPQDCLTEEN